MRLGVAALLLTLMAACGASASPAASDGSRESLADWHHVDSLTDLVQSADAIARVIVVQKSGEEIVAGGRAPVAFTAYQVRALRVLKGEPGATFTLLQLGRAGDTANTYPEFPLLTSGTEVLVFLRDVSQLPNFQDGRRKFQIVGLEGAYVVTQGRMRSLSSESKLRPVVDGKTTSEVESLILGAVR
jgi:hypothetical protein